MRQLLAAAILLLIMSNAFSQGWVASSRLSSPNDITYIQSRIDQDQNIYIFGSFSGVLSSGSVEVSSNGGRDYFLSKFNSDGNPLWISSIGGENDEDLTGGMTLSKDQEIILTGGFSDTIFTDTEDTLVSKGGFDIFLSRYSQEGDEIWMKSVLKGRNLQRATHLSIDNDNNLILVGQFKDSTLFNDAIAPAIDNQNLHGFYSSFSSLDGTLNWWKAIESLNSKEGVYLTKCISSKDQIILIGSFADSVVIDNDTIVSRDASRDAFILNSSISGSVNWVNFISGSLDEEAHSLLIDENDNIYVSGHYASPFLKTDFDTPDSLFTESNMGGTDLFMSKYSVDGQLDWLFTTGGSGDEKISESELFGDQIIVSGYYSDSLLWGDYTVTTRGTADKDLFMGYMGTDGAYNYIKTLTGTGNSHEESKGTVHISDDQGYGFIYSNSTYLKLGDDILSSPNSKFHITLGIMGCKILSIDYVSSDDVETCPGDSTGSIQVFASGGFGAPYAYSIDAGEVFTYNSSTISGLPKGIYQVAVMDREKCKLSGPTVQIMEPDPLVIEVISTADITLNSDGLIVVAAQGGTSPYSYTLLPDGEPQGYGTFIFSPGDQGAYVVEMNDGKLCGPVRTDTIRIRYLTGIDNLEGKTFLVFPNPATDIVTVELQIDAAEVNLEVVSLTGQVVMRKQAFTSGGELREAIDVSDLARGMYMLRVNGETLKSAIVVH